MDDLISRQAAIEALNDDTPWWRLNGLIYDIRPAEIADQISRDNLSSWCHTIQTEMAKCLVMMKVDEEEFR